MFQQDRKYMIGLKVLATIALVCTVVLWCGLWGASATPHDKSKVDTQEVTDKIDSKYGLSAKFAEKLVTQQVYASRSGTKYLYNGDKEKLKVWFAPAETLDRDVTFESKNPDVVSVDENGEITCHKKGEVKGNKESIIKTIAENANIEEVNGILNCFVVSRQELKVNEYKKRHLVEYEFYNREISGISLAEFKEKVAEYSLEEVTSYFDLNDSDLSFDQYIKKRENFSVADLQWQKLQKELKNSKDDFGRDVYYKMADFLYSEDKNKDNSLKTIAETFV